MYQLITIAFSHYCEKARWALDRARVVYRERRFMPLFHAPAAWKALAGTGAGRADKASTRYSTPILLGAGAPITDSSDIVRFADPDLYPDAEVEGLDRRFSDDLGPHSRRVVYYHLFRRPDLIFELADRNVGVAQAWSFRVAFPAARRLMKRALRIDRTAHARSLARVRAIMDEVGERLADGRPYLCGDRFTAADLSFAAMMAPGVLPGPESFGARLPELERLPPEAAAFVREVRAHPAGVHAARMFAEERWAPREN